MHAPTHTHMHYIYITYFICARSNDATVTRYNYIVCVETSEGHLNN